LLRVVEQDLDGLASRQLNLTKCRLRKERES